MSSEVITRNDLKNIINSLLPIFYPVGSYYETSDSTFNPNTEWGGTWELELAGQVHVSSGTGYAVNGAESNTSDGGSPYIQAHKHAYTAPTLPNHVHPHSHTHGTGASNDRDYFIVSKGMSNDNFSTLLSGSGRSHPQYNADDAFGVRTATSGPSSANTSNPTTNPSCGGSIGDVNNLPTGQTTGQAGNMPPYIVVNRWHRIA